MNKQINMRYLKKHKVFLIAVLLLIVMLIVIGMIGIRFSQKKAQDQFSNEQEQLSGMATYLDEIDKTVTTNTEHLAEASLLQTDTVQTLTNFSESLTHMEESVQCVEDLIHKHMEGQEEKNSEILLSISVLSESQQEISSQITIASTTITSILSDIKAANKGNFTTAFEKMNGLQEALEEAEKNAEDYYNSLDSLITLLQEENKAEHRELLENLRATKADITALLNSGFSGMRLQMEQDFTALMEQMNFLHKQITGTRDSIIGLLELIQEKDTDRQEEIREAFAAIGISLGQIKEDYTNAHMEISSLIQKLKETEAANHAETLSVLTVMENSMAESSIENLTQITGSLEKMADNLSASMSSIQSEMSQSFTSLGSEMTKNMSEYNSSMTNLFSQLDSNITNQYQNIASTVNNYDTSQQENFDNLMRVLEQNLQQVFQYVSDGKRKLASALLTKGVPIREDAAFEEIYHAILAIPQNLVIGVQEIPGTISYDYHYHVNGSGNMPHSEKEAASGGCYMNPVYHVHTGNGKTGGGCYGTPIYHTHTGSCYSEGSHNSSCPSHREYHSYDCGSVHDWDGDGHGCDGFVAYDCGGHRYLSCNKGSGIIGYSLNCGKSPSTIEYYTPVCGLSDGQIIGAHIVYEQSALLTQEVAAPALYNENSLAEEVEAGTGEAGDAGAIEEESTPAEEGENPETEESAAEEAVDEKEGEAGDMEAEAGEIGESEDNETPDEESSETEEAAWQMEEE